MKKPFNSIATSRKTHFEESEEEEIESSSEEEKSDDTIDSDEVGIFHYSLNCTSFNFQLNIDWVSFVFLGLL